MILARLFEGTGRRRLAFLVLRLRPLRRRRDLPLLLLRRRSWPALRRSWRRGVSASIRLYRTKVLPVAV